MNLSFYIKKIRKKGQRCFTLEQLMVDQGLSKNTALNAIYRLRGHGELISPARGFYVMIPPEHQPHGSIPAHSSKVKGYCTLAWPLVSAKGLSLGYTASGQTTKKSLRCPQEAKRCVATTRCS